MDSYQPTPLSLKIVAALFIFTGICSALQVVILLMLDHIYLNFGVLGLFIGPGLLRCSRGWRTCALVFLWIGLIFTPIAALGFLNIPEPLDFKLFGQVNKAVALSFVAIVFLLILWQYSVLTRQDVRELFYLEDDR